MKALTKPFSPGANRLADLGTTDSPTTGCKVGRRRAAMPPQRAWPAVGLWLPGLLLHAARALA